MEYGIPSFYTSGKVDQRYSFACPKKDFNGYDKGHQEFLKSENILTDYDSSNHIRIMKRFHHSDTSFAPEVIQGAWKEDFQEDMYLRCYLPKKKITSKSKNERVNKLIIMFNGLNEVMHFDLYDILGSQFANQGIASILLPTPYHLNRRVPDFEMSRKKMKYRCHIPTDYASGELEMMYYYNFKKSIAEVELLISQIVSNHSSNNGFYSSLFDLDNLKISLLGFSLGGLKAIGSFMKLKPDNPELIQSCVTWNSEPGLEDVTIEKINGNKIKYTRKTWLDLMKSIKTDLNGIIKKGNPSEKSYARLCKWLYFSQKKGNRNEAEFEALRDRLSGYSNNCLSIQSASDSIVKVSSFDRILTDVGLHRVIVPGVDHIPNEDIKWGEWLTRTVGNVIHFINESGKQYYSNLTIEDEIKTILIKTEYYKTRQIKYSENKEELSPDFSIRDLDSIRTDLLNQPGDQGSTERQKFVELYYVSKAFYPRFTELVDKIIKNNT
ncbi:hypothetical protein Q4Q34_07555 [Flavivirga abyssicola]|uniref:hypothetical protein n=1 Tax=Flavivirga abyssicola TaxID=3063533 RepID=UPI0026DF3726|nr:hypothetical protein [Flavivirga sp. MEBiC07777]WVK14882.1 hypothetical protein Q4Q34_07555 [Flavivirga sp. MEBiC07777]